MDEHSNRIAELGALLAEQHCEIRQLREQLAEAREALRAAYEVYAGSDGLIPQTAPEAYQQQLIQQMAEILGTALAGGSE